ncbi:aspartate aminotransferase [Seinonella peptonophila]|uniref:Aminotransferase n=1 Tax=Seinonella peptonophila TaxID=112248 RepID=A0A1M4SWH4_9BACL|nr:pyridoxal phosphate-dependent aminotransferase [Seinonella peptonophila]SHE36553.1 aspartate aminotransferase [Seinonella peptonophila]
MNRLSKRVQQLTPSPTLAITAKAQELKAAGHNVIGLGAGEPDFNTPKHILEAAKKAMDEGQTKYTPSSGIPKLRQAIVDKLSRENGLTYVPSQITVTVGAKHGLYNLFQVLLNKGDEVIVPMPYWVSYLDQITLAEGQPVILTTDEQQNFKITPEQLEAAITEKTKAVLINSPSNPTGMVYTPEELQKIGEICVKYDLWIISDEIYEHLVYDEQFSPVSIASLDPRFYERTFVINGVSKTYSMTGWRIGFVAGPADVINVMNDLSSHSVSNPTSIAQFAALAAFTGPQEPVKKMKAAFKERRDYVVNRIHEIEGLSCLTPPGAFYVFINIRKALEESPYQNSDEWSTALLEKEQVAVVPGSAFGSNHHVRISYATSIEDLQEAFKRIEHFTSHLAVNR